MKRRILKAISLICTCVMLLTLAACGEESQDNTGKYTYSNSEMTTFIWTRCISMHRQPLMSTKRNTATISGEKRSRRMGASNERRGNGKT